MARQTIRGGLGAPILSKTSGGNNRILSLTMETTVNYFKKLALVKPNIVANKLKMYTLMSVGNEEAAMIGSFKKKGHFLQPFKHGCTWTPKGGFTHTIEEIPMYRVSGQFEICHDVFLKGCMAKIYGTGNNIRDLAYTAEGAKLLATIIEILFEEIGNDLYDLLHFGRHPMIALSYANKWFRKYGKTDEEMDSYVDQQQTLTGLITLIDKLKAEGKPNYNVQIYPAHYNGREYTGDVGEDLFLRVFNAQSKEMRAQARQNKGTSAAGIISVSRGIYEKYETELIERGSNIVQGYRLYVSGSDGEPKAIADGLMWKGIPVILDDTWEEFDDTVGIDTHRVVFSGQEVQVIAYDIKELKQFTGMGMIIVQNLLPGKDGNGKILGQTDFRAGTGLVDVRHVVNASVQQESTVV